MKSIRKGILILETYFKKSSPEILHKKKEYLKNLLLDLNIDILYISWIDSDHFLTEILYDSYL